MRILLCRYAQWTILLQHVNKFWSELTMIRKVYWQNCICANFRSATFCRGTRAVWQSGQHLPLPSWIQRAAYFARFVNKNFTESSLFNLFYIRLFQIHFWLTHIRLQLSQQYWWNSYWINWTKWEVCNLNNITGFFKINLVCCDVIAIHGRKPWCILLSL